MKLQRVTVAGGAALQIRSLLDCLQYADPNDEAEAAGISPACWPLFGQVWPSEQKLALASLVIHRRNGEVTASDCHPLTEAFLHADLLLNDLSGVKYQTGH